MKRLASIFAAACALSASATPAIQNYSVEQIWGEKVLKVSFTLTEKAILTVDVLTNGVSIGATNYSTMRDPLESGNEFPANKIVAAGEHVWMWRPTLEWPERKMASEYFQVELKAWSFDDPPDYMIVTYNVKSNAYFYARAEDIPGGIKTADPSDADAVAALSSDPYRTSKIILRKIPAAGVKWRMGSPSTETYRQANEVPHYVTLTNDFYVTIYPLTFTQYNNFMDGQNDPSIRPKYNISYTTLRGAIASRCWPDNGYEVTSGSGLGKMRAKMGLRLDLLTEAEWEYACRAGSEAPWNGYTENEVAWHENATKTANAVYHPVGLKKPNAWGLYDMHGMANEWVLDQYGPYPTEDVIAPVGVTTNANMRILRGGMQNKQHTNGKWISAISTRSAYRMSFDPTKTQTSAPNYFGARVGCPAKLPDWMR